MAVIVNTSDPPALLKAIRSKITEGAITKWSLDSDGDFTYSVPQWSRKAWFRPKVSTDRIVFMILPPQKARMNVTTYAVYHGRFIEMLLEHFDTKFEQASSTALPAEGDQVK